MFTAGYLLFVFVVYFGAVGFFLYINGFLVGFLVWLFYVIISSIVPGHGKTQDRKYPRIQRLLCQSHRLRTER